MRQLPLLQLSESRWRVLQPAIYLVSILPALVCGLVFWRHLAVAQFLSIAAAVVLIQHAVNVFNDEVDWKKGADGEKKDSWYHFHQGNVPTLKTHAWTSLILGFGMGLFVIIQAHFWGILWVALPLLLLGLLYNHSHWTLSYTRWGEWVTGICYGPGVFGCMAYLLSQQFSWSLVFGSLAFSFLAVAVLLSHQPPQVLTDFAAGKASFAVRHGVEKTYQIARVLTVLTFCLLALVLTEQWNISLFVFLRLGILITLVWLLPSKLSPSVILKLVTLQILIFGMFLKGGW